MKIYNMVNIPSGFTPEVDYDKIWQSGYTAGYDSGYTDGLATCVDPLEEYLTFEILSSGNVVWAASSPNATGKTIEYRLNGGEWIAINSVDSVEIPVVAGDIVEFRGNNETYYWFGDYQGYFKPTDVQFNLKGNIMSLINSNPDIFSTLSASTWRNQRAFSGLFMECEGLIDAGRLQLPIINGYMGEYREMFLGCTNLTTAPALPATNLSDSMYMQMFQNCTSLTSTPVITIENLAEQGFNRTFNGCTSLTAAPITINSLSAANRSCEEMFNGCTNLVTAPILNSKYAGQYAYYYMFQDCSNLHYIKCMATEYFDDLATYWGWLSMSGTFVCPHDYSGRIPNGWTRVDAE